MPIVFVDYLKEFHKDLLDSSEIYFSSITESDLSQYGCYPTKKINSVIKDLRAGDTIVVAGGEVLCARNSTLFLHMPRNKRVNGVLIKLNRIPFLRDMLDSYAKFVNPTPWYYPYIPQQSKLKGPRGLTIKFCENIKSYKKIVPTLRLYPNANIITIDDDIIYPYDMVERLIIFHNMHPDCIIGYRAHKMKLDKDLEEFESYQNWEFETKDCLPSHDIFVTTGAGTLFPRGSLDDRVLDSLLFMDICSDADDIWLNAMAILNNTRRMNITSKSNYWEKFLLIDDNQDMALSNTNLLENKNDVQMKSVNDTYHLSSIVRKVLM